MKFFLKAIAILIVPIVMFYGCNSVDNSKDIGEVLEITDNSINKVKNSASVGSHVLFGKYEQDNNKSNGKEKIEWVVLEKKENKILVQSVYGLDNLCFDTKGTKVWSECSLRKWLNSDFLDESFSLMEKRYIKTTNVMADKNPKFKTKQGNDTQDSVFLLSAEEVKKYIALKDNLSCTPTQYAKARKTLIYKQNNCVQWWLRTSGDYSGSTCIVRWDGTIDYEGAATEQKNCVRPAMWIFLEES